MSLVVSPLNVRRKLPPVTPAPNVIVTTSLVPSARSSVAVPPTPFPWLSITTRWPPSTMRSVPPCPSRASAPAPPNKTSLPVPPVSVSLPAPPMSVTEPRLKELALIAFALSPPVSRACSIPVCDVESPGPNDNVELPSVMFASRVAINVSSPAPPVSESPPPLVMRRSSPELPINVSASLRPSSRRLPLTMLDPLITPPVPVPRIPKSEAASEPFNASIFKFLGPPLRSRTTSPVPEEFTVTLIPSPNELNRVMISLSVVAPLKSISAVSPSVNVIRTSAEISPITSPSSFCPVLPTRRPKS